MVTHILALDRCKPVHYCHSGAFRSVVTAETMSLNMQYSLTPLVRTRTNSKFVCLEMLCCRQTAFRQKLTAVSSRGHRPFVRLCLARSCRTRECMHALHRISAEPGSLDMFRLLRSDEHGPDRWHTAAHSISDSVHALLDPGYSFAASTARTLNCHRGA